MAIKAQKTVATTDSFGTFLRTLEHEEAKGRAEEPVAVLLRAIADGTGLVKDLVGKTGLSLSAFAEAYAFAKRNELITSTQGTEGECATLTALGRSMAEAR